jgi:uncharacterized LabA/DUF88 family protein
MKDRAVIFIDGNNWYNSLRKVAKVSKPGNLDYAKLSQKLAGCRQWVETRYYIGRAKYGKEYADQRRFLAGIQSQDSRITVHLGRLEPRRAKDNSAKKILDYLSNLTIRIDRQVYLDLIHIAKQGSSLPVYVEKAVDVSLAVDMVVMAERDEFDSAYLLSADGDFTPAVDAVRRHNKKIYAASPSLGRKLASVVNCYIPLKKTWFSDCYID